jgi:predicted nuclease of predicted toxin-antitoxin system
LKLFVDQNLAGAVAILLTDAGHDAVHASALGMERASDPDILEHGSAVFVIAPSNPIRATLLPLGPAAEA